jgi:hypothetical protein
MPLTSSSMPALPNRVYLSRRKKYLGLEDFMNVKETTVTNAAILVFMVNFSAALLQPFRQQNP